MCGVRRWSGDILCDPQSSSQDIGTAAAPRRTGLALADHEMQRDAHDAPKSVGRPAVVPIPGSTPKGHESYPWAHGRPARHEIPFVDRVTTGTRGQGGRGSRSSTTSPGLQMPPGGDLGLRCPVNVSGKRREKKIACPSHFFGVAWSKPLGGEILRRPRFRLLAFRGATAP